MKCYLLLFTRKDRCLPCGFPSVLCYVCMVLLDDNFHISRYPLQRGKLNVGKLPNVVVENGILFPYVTFVKTLHDAFVLFPVVELLGDCVVSVSPCSQTQPPDIKGSCVRMLSAVQFLKQNSLSETLLTFILC